MVTTAYRQITYCHKPSQIKQFTKINLSFASLLNVRSCSFGRKHLRITFHLHRNGRNDYVFTLLHCESRPCVYKFGIHCSIITAGQCCFFTLTASNAKFPFQSNDATTLSYTTSPEQPSTTTQHIKWKTVPADSATYHKNYGPSNCTPVCAKFCLTSIFDTTAQPVSQ